MRVRSSLLIALSLALISLLAAGCGPSKEQILMARAMSTRVARDPEYVESARFLKRYLSKHDKDYVMWSMDYSSICMMGGNYDAARAELLKCFLDIEKRQDVNKEKAAALADESAKIFKGEPFERAMVCTYLGMLHYLAGDYNNARVFCNRADMADATTAENMKDFRHDFRLAHYWLGRTYVKLGDEGNAGVAFRKAAARIPRKGEQNERKRTQRAQTKARKKRMRLEAQGFKQYSQGEKAIPRVADMSASPAMAEMPAELPGALPAVALADPVLLAVDNLQQFFSPAYQKEVNLILVIEVGMGPVKFLVGDYGYTDRIIRAGYPGRDVMVYLNGHQAGRAFQMLDMFHQADTRGTSEKDRAQVTKAVTKGILEQLPFVSYVSSAWNVQADHRYWHLLPGEVFLFAAKVEPGTYTIHLRCFDSNGYLLPRYRLTRHHMPVRAGMENIYFLHTKPEADNTYVAKKS